MSDRLGDPKLRRESWTRCTEEAYEFMREARALRVRECGAPLRPLQGAAAGAGVQVTFSTRPHVGGRPRMFYLRSGLIEDFLAVCRAMNDRGWRLHVEDAYRSRQMQRELSLQDYTFDAILDRVRWELGGRMPDADLLLRRCSVLVATMPKVATHMAGSALDVSVYALDDGLEVDRGAAYLEMSELTCMDSPFCGPEARRNRKEITAIFERFGFVAYPFEFWHYSKGDVFEAQLRGESRQARYGAVDFEPSTGKVRAIAQPGRQLVSVDTVRRMIEKRLSGGRQDR